MSFRLPYNGIINKWCQKLGQGCIHCCFYYTILCQLNAAVIFGFGWILLQSVQIACRQVLSTSVKTHSNSSDSFSRRCITSFSNCDLFIRRHTRHNLHLSVCSTKTLAERNKSSLGGVPAEILTSIT